jgi:hypothetical protein
MSSVKSNTSGKEDLIHQWFWYYAEKHGIRRTDPPGVKNNIGNFSTENLERVFGLVDPSESPRNIRNIAFYGISLGKNDEPCGFYFCSTASELTDKNELQRRLDIIKEHTGKAKVFINKRTGKIKPNVFIGLKTNSATFAPNAYTKEDITKETVKKLVDYIIDQDEEWFGANNSRKPLEIKESRTVEKKADSGHSNESRIDEYTITLLWDGKGFDIQESFMDKIPENTARYVLENIALRLIKYLEDKGVKIDKPTEMIVDKSSAHALDAVITFSIVSDSNGTSIKFEEFEGKLKYGYYSDFEGMFLLSSVSAMLESIGSGSAVGGDHAKESNLDWAVVEIESLMNAAEGGDMDAQYNLGERYYNGDGVEEDDGKAFFWTSKAALMGQHRDAQKLLGDMYLSGHGVDEDITQAAYWYTMAGDQGDLESQYNLGSMYFDGNGVPESKKLAAFWWERAADQGDAEAQYRLGYLYMAGEGVEKNPTKAVSLVKSAASQGYEQAIKLMEELGNQHKGQDAADDDENYMYKGLSDFSILGATSFYLKTTWFDEIELPFLTLNAPSWVFEGKNREGILNLFLENLYENIGGEPPRDIKEFVGKEAVLPYNITKGDDGTVIETWAEKISMFDRHSLATSIIMYLDAKNTDIKLIELRSDFNLEEHDESDDDDYYDEAEDEDEEEANLFFAQGLQYHQGRDVEQDRKQAMRLMKKAAEKGHVEAQCYVASHYYEGKGVERDFGKAYYWYKKSAEGGDSDAQLTLGVMYANGQGTDPNLINAELWLKASAEQGNRKAQNFLEQHFNYEDNVEDYFNNSDYEGVPPGLLAAARRGDREAQCDLGAMFYDGRGVDVNYDIAAHWYTKSAQQGDLMAMYNLANCYYYGDGVEEDEEKSKAWFRKALAGGYAAADERMHELYGIDK